MTIIILPAVLDDIFELSGYRKISEPALIKVDNSICKRVRKLLNRGTGYIQSHFVLKIMNMENKLWPNNIIVLRSRFNELINTAIICI